VCGQRSIPAPRLDQHLYTPSLATGRSTLRNAWTPGTIRLSPAPAAIRRLSTWTKNFPERCVSINRLQSRVCRTCRSAVPKGLPGASCKGFRQRRSPCSCTRSKLFGIFVCVPFLCQCATDQIVGQSPRGRVLSRSLSKPSRLPQLRLSACAEKPRLPSVRRQWLALHQALPGIYLSDLGGNASYWPTTDVLIPFLGVH
jgi:hypothetical protein